MYAHRLSRHLVSGLLAFSALFALGCDDTDTVSGPTVVTTGSVRAAVAVFGTQPDPDGYLVGLSTGGQSDPASQAVNAVGGSVSFADVSPGTHSVRLESLAANCAVAGDNPHPSTVLAGKETLVRFAVLCPASLSTRILTHTSIRDGDAPNAFAQRYFLEEDGTFALDFGRAHTSSAEMLGTYASEGTVLLFDFGHDDFGEALQATGTPADYYDEGCLSVDYNDALESYSAGGGGSSDFVDDLYCPW